MPKVLVEFDSIEQAQAAIHAVTGNQAPAPAPHFLPNVAPAPYVPPQPAPMAPAPAPYAPPAQPQQFAPPAGMPMPAPAPAPAPMAPQPAPMASAAPAAPSGITQAQLSAAAQAYAKKHTPKGAKAKLAEFGITKISEAHESIYPQLLQALSA